MFYVSLDVSFETLSKNDSLIIVFVMDTVLKPMNMYDYDLFTQEEIYIIGTLTCGLSWCLTSLSRHHHQDKAL